MHRSLATLGRGIVSSTLSLALLLAIVSMRTAPPAQAAVAPSATEMLTSAGVTGGLCVIAGSASPADAIELARTGRYHVHVLDADAAKVAALQKQLHDERLYGLAFVEELRLGAKLPYTENLVNAVFVNDPTLPLNEIARVLQPGGVAFVQGKAALADLSAAGLEAFGTASNSNVSTLRKRWPAEMDQWAQPRHGADGNAVSNDLSVSTPRRVRWVTGPQMEISNFVTGGGRAFFAGVLARDAFNGLRLWEENLNPSPARGGFNQTVGSAVQPIVAGQRLLVYHDNKLRALDAATGKSVREYPDAGVPTEVLLVGKTIVVTTKEDVRVLDIDTGKLAWKQAAPAVRGLAAGDGITCYIQGDPKQAASIALVSRDLATGKLRWQETKQPWLPRVRRCTLHQQFLACEISTLNDDKPGNILQMVAAADGKPLWSREFVPGSAHKRQARAIFVGDLVWVLEMKRCVGLDPQTGQEKKAWPATSVHCFPPVATARYLLTGEMDLVDFATGLKTANPITKQACSRDAGVVPANGLIYTFPKHCICWPMLRDYAALAPERPGGAIDWSKATFTPEAGPASPVALGAPENPAQEWPMYRHDAFRSGSTPADVARDLKVLWMTTLGDRPTGTITQDWRENFFIRAPVGPPVIGGGLVYVTRPDAHQVVALEAVSGNVRWSFTANGRVDTAPTLYRGLCLFGCKSGYVYALRASDGALVWRLRAAPVDERIVAYGQVESPWPVPGSVLIADNLAYFAAGRQPLADGGIFVFAVEPATGTVRWHKRLDSVPQKNFYNSTGLEFDNFDLLQVEGDAVAMSRWIFDRSTGEMKCDAKSGFTVPGNGNAGTASVVVPRGSWSYAPRNESEQWKERPYVRPLAVFRDNALFSCTQDRGTVYRRDFKLTQGEKFDTNWFAGWATYKGAREGGDLWQSQRLIRGAVWTAVPFGPGTGTTAPTTRPTQVARKTVAAMVLAGDTVYAISSRGELRAIDAATGNTVGELEVPAPAWDSLAAAAGKLFLTTQDGRVVCLGKN